MLLVFIENKTNDFLISGMINFNINLKKRAVLQNDIEVLY